MVPPTFWLVLFLHAALALVWIYSFGERGPQGQTLLAFSFANYARALEWIHLGILFKSLAIAALTTAISLLIGLPVALGIAFAPVLARPVAGVGDLAVLDQFVDPHLCLDRGLAHHRFRQHRAGGAAWRALGAARRARLAGRLANSNPWLCCITSAPWSLGWSMCICHF